MPYQYYKKLHGFLNKKNVDDKVKAIFDTIEHLSKAEKWMASPYDFKSIPTSFHIDLAQKEIEKRLDPASYYIKHKDNFLMLRNYDIIDENEEYSQ